MRTIETTVMIGSDGKLTLQLPNDIQSGQYRVVIVIDEIPSPTREAQSPLDLQAVDWPNWPVDSTFRREELYDDNGR